MKAFGQWDGIVHDLILYVIDNEIHHRGQGYVYLRALGVEPPAFYVRDRGCGGGRLRRSGMPAIFDGTVLE